MGQLCGNIPKCFKLYLSFGIGNLAKSFFHAKLLARVVANTNKFQYSIVGRSWIVFSSFLIYFVSFVLLRVAILVNRLILKLQRLLNILCILFLNKMFLNMVIHIYS